MPVVQFTAFLKKLLYFNSPRETAYLKKERQNKTKLASVQMTLLISVATPFGDNLSWVWLGGPQQSMGLTSLPSSITQVCVIHSICYTNTQSADSIKKPDTVIHSHVALSGHFISMSFKVSVSQNNKSIISLLCFSTSQELAFISLYFPFISHEFWIWYKEIWHYDIGKLLITFSVFQELRFLQLLSLNKIGFYRLGD